MLLRDIIDLDATNDTGPSPSAIAAIATDAESAAVDTTTGSSSSTFTRTLPPLGMARYHSSKREALRPIAPLLAVPSSISAPPTDSKVVPPSP